MCSRIAELSNASAAYSGRRVCSNTDRCVSACRMSTVKPLTPTFAGSTTRRHVKNAPSPTGSAAHATRILDESVCFPTAVSIYYNNSCNHTQRGETHTTFQQNRMFHDVSLYRKFNSCTNKNKTQLQHLPEVLQKSIDRAVASPLTKHSFSASPKNIYCQRRGKCYKVGGANLVFRCDL